MRTKSETFQFEKTLNWETPAPGIRRQIMAYDGQLMMVKVHFEKGAVGTMHEHYHSQATYVVIF
jgi:quercetin dioxygenase-like cupin family protein